MTTMLDERYLTGDPSAIHVPVPTTQTVWAEVDGRLGRRQERTAGRNTYEWRMGHGAYSPVAVTYHRTRIVTAYVDGSVELDSNGWRTYTTKERMNRYLPAFKVGDLTVRVSLHQDHGTWKLSRSVYRADLAWEDANHHLFEDLADYHDGMVIGANGMVIDDN